jgi:hypothetical protein
MQASSGRCAPTSSARTPNRVGFWVTWLFGWLRTPPLKPPSRGMQASSGRCAPTSSARTPARVGFNDVLVDSVLARKRAFHSNLAAHTTASLAPLGFAAPMVGAPPDNIRAQRLAEGGVPTSGAGSADRPPSPSSQRTQPLTRKKLKSDKGHDFARFCTALTSSAIFSVTRCTADW